MFRGGVYSTCKIKQQWILYCLFIANPRKCYDGRLLLIFGVSLESHADRQNLHDNVNVANPPNNNVYLPRPTIVEDACCPPQFASNVPRLSDSNDEFPLIFLSSSCSASPSSLKHRLHNFCDFWQLLEIYFSCQPIVCARSIIAYLQLSANITDAATANTNASLRKFAPLSIALSIIEYLKCGEILLQMLTWHHSMV